MDTLHENVLVNCLTIYADRPMVKLFTSESDIYFYIFVKFFASLQQDSGEEKVYQSTGVYLGDIIPSGNDFTDFVVLFFAKSLFLN